MSALLNLQFEFAASLARLIQRANALGYNVKVAEVYRPPAQAALNAADGSGIAHSLHCDYLAVDLILFKDGKYLTLSEDYKVLGDWWKSQGPAYCWGGDFHSRPDGNHFSISPDGVRK